jgi:hypothetical protein
MSDAILIDCSTVAICHTTTKLTVHWREDSTFTTTSPTSASDVVGQQNKIGGIVYGTPYVVYMEKRGMHLWFWWECQKEIGH